MILNILQVTVIIIMDIYRGKVAVVTGASSGIGAVTAKRLVSHGLKVLSKSKYFLNISL